MKCEIGFIVCRQVIQFVIYIFNIYFINRKPSASTSVSVNKLYVKNSYVIVLPGNLTAINLIIVGRRRRGAGK